MGIIKQNKSQCNLRYKYLFNYSKDLYFKSFDILKNLYRFNPDKYLNEILHLYINLALLFNDANEYETAENCIEIILKTINDSNKDSIPDSSQLLARCGAILLNYAASSKKPEIINKTTIILNNACEQLAEIYNSNKQDVAEEFADALYNKAKLLRLTDNKGYLHTTIEGLYLRCVDLYSKCNNIVRVAQTYYQLGSLKKSIKDYTKAKDMFIKSLTLYKSLSLNNRFYSIMITIIDEICDLIDIDSSIGRKDEYLTLKQDLIKKLK